MPTAVPDVGHASKGSATALVIGRGSSVLSLRGVLPRRAYVLPVSIRGRPAVRRSRRQRHARPVTEAEFGERELLPINLAAADAWPGFATQVEERSGRSVGLTRCVMLMVALAPRMQPVTPGSGAAAQCPRQRGGLEQLLGGHVAPARTADMRFDR